MRLGNIFSIQSISALLIATACAGNDPYGPANEPRLATLLIGVNDDADAPVPGVAITVTHAGGTRGGVTTSTGVLRVDSLQPGNATVLLTLPAAYRADSTQRSIPLNAGGTATTAFAVALRAGVVRVDVQDSLGGVVGGAVIEATTPGQPVRSESANAFGTALFARVRAGTYEFIVTSGANRVTMPVQVGDRDSLRVQVQMPPSALGSWRVHNAMPNARASLAAVSGDSAVYVLGGLTSDVDRFDGNAWQLETQMPAILNAPAAAFINGELIVIGGFEGSGNVPTDRVRIYNVASRTWREGARMPTARGGIQAIVLSGRVHVIGGGNQFSTLAAHEAYNPATDSWQTLPALPNARGNPALGALNGKIYAIGGASAGETFTSVDVFDATSQTWTAGPPISPSRVAARAVVYRGRLYVFGGEGSSGPALRDARRLNEAGNAWEAVTAMPTGRSYAASAIWNDAVFLFGGSPQAPTLHTAGGLRTVESFVLRN